VTRDSGGLAGKIFILSLMAIIITAGTVACSEPVSKITTATPYKLTHSTADAEHILSWDFIVSRCADIGDYDKEEIFIRRGETVQTTPGAPVLSEDSPAAWGSIRGVQLSPTGEKIRGFGIFIMYCETADNLDDYIESVKLSGFPVEKEGDFVTGVVEATLSPMKTAQFMLAGKNFAVLIMESASTEESLFFNKEQLIELLPIIKENISSMEITALPSDIPERRPPGETYVWQELMTFHSDELPPPVRVPEEQQYNDLIYSERPLMQVFNFMIDKDWRFVMTAEGEADTRFEVNITVMSTWEEAVSYSSDHVFTLHSAPLTVIREVPLKERYAPPVNIEIEVFFDKPMDWTMRIEK
jgi:hypothetical protein